ncbi:arylesterase [Psychrobacter sp. Marseille-P5312]|uniref:arylesterase n=1 Tax=Psychrobacter sp. Marseille-P5312 TaxID=2086574 RepID=UPI0039B70065
MMKPSSRLTSHLPVAAFLAMVMATTGCQKSPDNADTTLADSTQPTPPISQTTQTSQTADTSSPSRLNEQQAALTILALGDSLTEGLGVSPEDNYPAQLEAQLKKMGYPNITVVNSGLSGETSTGLVNRLDWVLQTKPDITILTIGANDAMRGIEVATIENNIRTAIKRLQAGGSEVILGGMQIYDNLGSDYVESFAAIYPRIAEDTGVTLIPFFLDGVGGDAALNQADAIHPTKEGYRMIVNENVLPVLTPKLEKIVESERN